MLIPRKETNGGMSAAPARNFDTTAPNDGWCWVRLVCSLYPVITYESECSSTDTSERTTASLSNIFAWRGKCSLICTPGTVVGIGLDSPRNSGGGAGLRSYMSRGLGA